MAIISVYAIKGIDADSNWTEAWDVVEQPYGGDAICRNVFQSDASVDDEISVLKNILSSDSTIREMLESEFDDGATHAFVQPQKGKPLFGLSLHKIFG